MKSLLAITLATFASAAAGIAEVEKYKIDTAHSAVRFEIKHFFTPVSGSFGNFSGQIHYDTETPSDSKAIATIKVASVNTNNDKRDNHLRTDDFFSADQFPEMTFESTSWRPMGSDKFEVTGDLTMLGTTREVTLDVELLGFGEGREGKKISGWEATTTVDRRDWGMKGFNPPVGNKVDVTINVQGHLMESRG